MAKAIVKSLDFEDLVKEFSKVFPDYNATETAEKKTLSLIFAEQVIFVYGPEVKNIKQSGTDHTWHYKFEMEDSIRKIYVTTTFFKKNVPEQPRFKNNKIKLTFKQASLLAVHKYCQVVPLHLEQQKIILTPLAGAVFNKNSIGKLLADLQTLQSVVIPMNLLIEAIICSCQTDGYHLPRSNCHIAVAAICCNVVKKELRESLIESSIKNYAARGKEFDVVKFNIYMRHVNRHRDIFSLISFIEKKYAENLMGKKFLKEIAGKAVSSSSSSSESDTDSDSDSDTESDTDSDAESEAKCNSVSSKGNTLISDSSSESDNDKDNKNDMKTTKASKKPTLDSSNEKENKNKQFTKDVQIDQNKTVEGYRARPARGKPNYKKSINNNNKDVAPKESKTGATEAARGGRGKPSHPRFVRDSSTSSTFSTISSNRRYGRYSKGPQIYTYANKEYVQSYSQNSRRANSCGGRNRNKESDENANPKNKEEKNSRSTTKNPQRSRGNTRNHFI